MPNLFMSNVSDDWNMWNNRCGLCNRIYHASEGYCSCSEDYEPCECGDNEWTKEDNDIFCENCGTRPNIK